MSAVAAPANIDALLQRLDRVRPYGTGWRASCPVCGGRSRDKLSITATDDGRILINAFCGCDKLQILQTLGLSLSDLFPERLAAQTPEQRREAARRMRETGWGGALDVLEFEARILVIAASELLAGRPIESDDHQRLVLAQQRIEDAATVLRNRPAWRPDTAKVGT